MRTGNIDTITTITAASGIFDALDVENVGRFHTTNTFPTGPGDATEVAYYTTGGFGYVQAYNRATSTYLPTKIIGSYVDLCISGSTSSLAVTSTGIGIGCTPTTDLTIGTAGAGVSPNIIKINNDGYSVPSNSNTEAAGDKLIMWNDATGKCAIGLSQNWCTYIQSNGTADSNIKFYTSPNTVPLERVQINSAGQVGIGCTPIMPLHLKTNADTTFSGNPSSVYLESTQAYGAIPNGNGIWFGGKYNSADDSTVFAAINGMKANAVDDDYDGMLRFSTRLHGGMLDYYADFNKFGLGINCTPTASGLSIDSNCNTECLRLFGADKANEIADIYVGNVGELHISTLAGNDSYQQVMIEPKDDVYGMTLYNSGGLAGGIYASFKMVDAATDYLNITCKAGNPTLGITLDANQNVGIGNWPLTGGTTAVYRGLTHTGAGDATHIGQYLERDDQAGFVIERNKGGGEFNDYWFMALMNSSKNLGFFNGTFFGATSNWVMIMGSNGYVGIGCTPATTLDVDSNSDSQALRIRGALGATDYTDIFNDSAGTNIRPSSTSGGYGRIAIRPNGSTDVGLILYEHGSDGTYSNFTVNDAATDYLNITTDALNSTLGLTVDSNQCVGIGCTPSGVSDSVTAKGNIVPADNDTYYLGRNDDDLPLAWKGIILKDTTNGKYYRIEVTSGLVVATDLSD